MNLENIMTASIVKRLVKISELLDEYGDEEKAENIAELADKVNSGESNMSEEEFAKILEDLGLEVN
jgi:hypothetical protein